MPLAREGAIEDEAAALAPEVAALRLPHAVQEHLELAPDTRRQLDPRPLGHRS